MGEIAAGASIDPSAQLGDDVSVAHGAVIEAGVQIGARCVVEAHVVLGKRPRLRPSSSAAALGSELEPLVIDSDVTVCAGALVYAGAMVSSGVIIGDQSQVRERAVIGADSVIGRASCVDFAARVGSRVLIQTGVYVTGGAVVEDDVFLGPGVITTNDHTMGRHPRGEPLQGPVFRRACRVGGGAVVLPGIVVGEEAFVAAGALVTRDVGEREVVMGVPARAVRRVEDHDLIEGWA